MTSPKSRQRNRSRGLFLVLVVFFIVVVLALAALAIGGGMLLTATARAQNVANAAASAGIDALAKSSGENLEEWNDDTVNRINQILEENSAIPGMSRRLGPLATTPNENGKVELGFFYPELPTIDPPTEELCPAYPCFLEATEEDVRPTAVRVTLASAPDNLLWMPFAAILGSSFGEVSAEAISRVIPSCTVFLSDLSLSMAKQTHNTQRPKYYCRPPNGEGNCACTDQIERSGAECETAFGAQVSVPPYWRIPTDASPVPPVGRFAYRANYALGPGCTLGEWFSTYGVAEPPPPPASCDVRANGCKDCRCEDHYTLANPLESEERDEFRAWCNLPFNRVANNSTPGVHYQDDYYEMTVYLRKQSTLMDTYTTRFLVDKYFLSQAEPLRTALLATNAGLRVRDEFKTEMDRAIMLGFTAEVVAWLHNNENWQNGGDPLWIFDSDTERLLSASNYNYMGLFNSARVEHSSYPPVPYNFLVKGFFPRSEAPDANFDTPAGSNLQGAIIDAANALADPNKCPLEATKNIILFSDGHANCMQPYTISGDSIVRGDGPFCLNQEVTGHPFRNTSYSKFQWIKDNFLNRPNNLTEFLAEHEIAFTAILVDDEAEVAVRLMEDGAGWYYSAEQLLRSGESNVFPTDPYIPGDQSEDFNNWKVRCVTTLYPNFSNYSPPLCTPEHYAFTKHGDNGVAFREALDLWSRVASRTNGSVCPIRRPCYEIPEAPCGPSGGESEGYELCYEDHDEEPSTPARLKAKYLEHEAFLYQDEGGRSYLRCAEIEQTQTEQAVACVMAALGFAPYQSVAVE